MAPKKTFTLSSLRCIAAAAAAAAAAASANAAANDVPTPPPSTPRLSAVRACVRRRPSCGLSHLSIICVGSGCACLQLKQRTYTLYCFTHMERTLPPLPPRPMPHDQTSGAGVAGEAASAARSASHGAVAGAGTETGGAAVRLRIKALGNKAVRTTVGLL